MLMLLSDQVALEKERKKQKAFDAQLQLNWPITAIDGVATTRWNAS